MLLFMIYDLLKRSVGLYNFFFVSVLLQYLVDRGSIQ